MKEFLQPKVEHPFRIEVPFLFDEGDFPKLLALLRDSEFRDEVSMEVRFHDEEPHKHKWHVVFFAATAPVLVAFSKRVAALVNFVWYGPNITMRTGNDTHTLKF